MEPFGLFQLLQSILPQNTNPAEPTAPPLDVDKDGENASPPPVTEPPTYTAAQAAVLDFMDAHERRAKRLR